MKQHLVRYIIIIYCICLFSGCAAPVTAQDTALFAMDTVMELRLYGDDGSAADELRELLTRLDRTLSVTDEQSAVCALNRNGRSEDETVLALLEQSMALRERTGGAVDPSVYPVVRLWGFTSGDYRVPAQEELDLALACVGPAHVHTDGAQVTLDPGAALEFGAFAKGWAADLCRAALERRQISAILTLGGNIQTVGNKPDGTPWRVGVADPEHPTDYLLTLELSGSQAVVTSGDYQRFFEQDGVRYCHIFDPASGLPVRNGLRSVTVVCGSGVTADGLSTALFVMGLERAEAFWRESSDFEAVFVLDDGRVFVTEGLQDAATGCPFTVMERRGGR